MSELVQMLRLIRRYRRASTLPMEGLLSIQRDRLRSLLAHARAHSPYYKEVLDGLDLEAACASPQGLRSLPTLDKATLMERFDDIVCDRSLKLAEIERFMADPANDGRRYRGKVLIRTSGTSGRAVVVAYGPAAFNHVRAVNLARGSMVDASGWRILQRALDPSALKLACVLMDGGFAPSHANFLHQPAASRWFIELERISLRLPIQQIVDRLQAYQPQILFAYPSVLELLCHEALAGRLDILNQERARAVSLSEPLTPRVRQLVTDSFGVPVFDLYGAGECLPIARSCACGAGLHVNVDMVAVEVVDSNGQPVPDGSFGAKVLVTNLFNPLLPVIRYELGDIAAITREPCACGSSLPRLISVRGRSDELVWLDHPDGGRRALHPYLVLETLLAHEEVLDWQLVQSGPRALQLNLVLPPGIDAAGLPAVRAVQAEVDAVVPPGSVQVEARRVARIEPDEVSGKVKRVVVPSAAGASLS